MIHNVHASMSFHTLSGFFSIFFFFNDTATTEIYTLSLHDALPICAGTSASNPDFESGVLITANVPGSPTADRKSTRLNSSHVKISYAVFCLKKKKKQENLIVFENNKSNAS